jgi:predicted RNase H-like HicB family nuclease/DNA-binding transcriptional MerR regulator
MVARANGFSAEFTRKLAGVTYRQLDYWDKTGLIRPSIQKARGKGSRRLYSFEDIVELRVVSRLLGVGIALPAVRKAARYLRLNFKQFGRPLAQLSLIVDGRRMFVRATDPKHLIDITAGGQLVISVAVAPILEDVRGQVAELRAPRELTVRVGAKQYTLLLTPDLEVGGYTVEVPELPGVITEGDTLAEARKMAKEAIRLWLSVQHAPTAKRRAAR